MAIDLVEIFQHRMDKAAAEQIWSVAILGSLNAFVILNTNKLRLALTESKAIWGIKVITALVCIFLWSRHGIYWYYSRRLDELTIIAHSVNLSNLTWLETLARTCVMWSGVFLYTAICVGMAYASVKALKKVTLPQEP